MGRKRKTFDIADLLFTVNRRNEVSTCDAKTRQGWNSLLENVLHGADLYSGYNYLEAGDLRESATSSKPGIQFEYVDGTVMPSGTFFDRLDAWNTELREAGGGNPVHCRPGDRRVFPDESRRVYYVHPSIRERYNVLLAREERAQAIESRNRRRADFHRIRS